MTNLYGRLTLNERENILIKGLINGTENTIHYLYRPIVDKIINLDDNYAFTVVISYNDDLHKLETEIILHYGDKDLIKRIYYNELKEEYILESIEEEIYFKIYVEIEPI